MNNKSNKPIIIISIFFEIILIITSIISISSRQWNTLVLSLWACVCIILPFIIDHIANKKNIILPSNFKLISLLFVFLSLYFGEIQKFYVIFWWWDLFLHSIFGIYAVIIALHLIKGIIIKDTNVTEKRFGIFIIIFAFNFSITLGTLWEMFEFLMDYLFNFNMVNGGLEDTASDLLIKILSAFITTIIYYYRNFKNKK